MTGVLSDNTPLLQPAAKAAKRTRHSRSLSVRTLQRKLKSLPDSAHHTVQISCISHPRCTWTSCIVLFSCLVIPCLLGGTVVLRIIFGSEGAGAVVTILVTTILLYLAVSCVIIRVVQHRRERAVVDLEGQRSSDHNECRLPTSVRNGRSLSTTTIPECLGESSSMNKSPEPLLHSTSDFSQALPLAPSQSESSELQVDRVVRNRTITHHRRRLSLLTVARAANLTSVLPDAVYAAPIAPSLSDEPALLAARTLYLAHAQELGYRTDDALTSTAPSADPPDSFALDGRLATLETPSWFAPSPSVSPLGSVSPPSSRSSCSLPSCRAQSPHSAGIDAGEAHSQSDTPDGEVELREGDAPQIGEHEGTQEHAMLVFAQFRSALERLEQGQRETVERVAEDL